MEHLAKPRSWGGNQTSSTLGMASIPPTHHPLSYWMSPICIPYINAPQSSLCPREERGRPAGSNPPASFQAGGGGCTFIDLEKKKG